MLVVVVLISVIVVAVEVNVVTRVGQLGQVLESRVHFRDENLQKLGAWSLKSLHPSMSRQTSILLHQNMLMRTLKRVRWILSRHVPSNRDLWRWVLRSRSGVSEGTEKMSARITIQYKQ